MLRYLAESTRQHKARLAHADRLAREEARRKKGVRYTYIVTATNGVGVRHLPDTRAERTGTTLIRLDFILMNRIWR